MKIKMDKIYKETINNPKEFVDILVLSALVNREDLKLPINIIEINVGTTDIFDFTMKYEDKLRLYNLGFSA